MFLAFIGMFISLLILSLKTGLIIGVSKVSKRKILIISFGFGCVLYFLIMLFTPHMQKMATFIDKYTFEGSMILAVFLIYLGLHEESQCDENSLCKRKNNKYIIAFLPCPFCLIAMAVSVIFFRFQVKDFHKLLEFGIPVLFIILIIMISYTTRWIIENKKIQPGSILNPTLLLFGVTTITLGLFIPNFVNSAKMPFSPININSLKVLISVVSGLFFISLIGFITYGFKNKTKENIK